MNRIIGNLWAMLCRLTLLAALGICLGGLVMLGMRYPLGAAVMFAALGWKIRNGRHRPSISHGSATTADLKTVERHGLLGDHGLILGQTLGDKPSKRAAFLALLSPALPSVHAVRTFYAAFLHRSWLGGQFIRVKDYVHLASFSPAGGGKGVSVLVPNLRSYPGSCVVTDPKPELVGLTAEHRRRKFGHQIFVLDPFGRAVDKKGKPLVKSATLNPLDFIAKDANDPDFVDQCRDLANRLVIRIGQEKDPHWNDSCETVLTASIAFVCACEPDPAKRNFQTVRKIVSSRHRYEKAVEVMQQITEFHGVIERLGGQLTWFQDRELGSVLTTVQRTTNFLDSPLVAANTATSSFDPMILRKRRATVYLVLPPDKQALSNLLRLQIGTIMRRITSGPPTEKNPVLWLLDEYAHLGRIEAVEDAVTLMRGMGMRLWFFFQSKDQMKTCFGDKASTIADNIGTQQYFNLTSYETAEELSKRIGDTTIGIKTGSWSRSSSRPTGGKGDQSGNVSSSDSVNTSEIARRLLKPEEILQLHDVMLVFHKHLPVIVARPVKWFASAAFRRGGTGQQAGLGLGGGIVAAAVLMAGVAIGSITAAIANEPVTQRPGRASERTSSSRRSRHREVFPPGYRIYGNDQH